MLSWVVVGNLIKRESYLCTFVPRQEFGFAKRCGGRGFGFMSTNSWDKDLNPFEAMVSMDSYGGKGGYLGVVKIWF